MWASELRWAGDRRVRDDNAVDAGGERDGRDVGAFLGRQVRGYLDQQWRVRAGFVTRREHLAQQHFEHGASLQIAQPRRIRRRHVDDEVIGEGGGAPYPLWVVGGCIRTVAVLADIDADDAACMPPYRQSCDDAFEPAAVEPHAVD